MRVNHLQSKVIPVFIFLLWSHVCLATPSLRSVSPASAIQGATISLTVSGDDFESGSTNLAFSGTGIVVNGVRVVDARTIVANVTVLGEPGLRTIALNGAGGGVAFEILRSPMSNPADPVVARFNGPSGGFGSSDGRGTGARFTNPFGIWSDGTSLFVADSGTYTIRQISIATAQVTTLAGTPQKSGYVDGPGRTALFLSPTTIWGDGVNLYVGDNGTMIRKVVIASGQVSTLAGTTIAGLVDGPRDQARLNGVDSLTGDGTYLYVANRSFQAVEPGAIRAISIATGEMHSIAMPAFYVNMGHTTFALLPTGLWVLDGYLYTVWPSTAASLAMGRINLATQQFERMFNFDLNPISFGLDIRFYPGGLWFDGAGNFYFVEGATVRRFVLATGALSDVATLPQGAFTRPTTLRSLWGNGESVFVTDRDSGMVSRADLQTGTATIFAGLPLNAPVPETLDSAFPGPVVWVDGVNVYVNNGTTIQKYDVSGNPSTVVARNVGLLRSNVWVDDSGIYAIDDNHALLRFAPQTDQPATIATGFVLPQRIWGNATQLYVVDYNVIRRVDKATGENIVFAGPFAGVPAGIWGDRTFLYVAEDENHAILRIRIATAEVTTLAANLSRPKAIWGDGVNLFVTDASENQTRKIVTATGEVTTVANIGSSNIWGGGGFLYESTFRDLQRITLATSAVQQLQPALQYSEGLVPADRFQISVSWGDGEYLYGVSGHAIYRTGVAAGEIEHLAGSFAQGGLIDGIGRDARFWGPQSLWGDGTFLYVVDNGNVRRVNISTREVTTFASGFQYPVSIWGDSTFLYVADNSRHALERITISTRAVTRLSESFQNIGALWGDGSVLYISDACSIRKFNLAGSGLTTLLDSPAAGSDACRYPNGLSLWGNGRLLFVSGSRTIRTVDLATGEVRAIAGNPDLPGSINGPGLEARFLEPGRIWGDGETLFVSDNGLRRISFANAAPPFSVSLSGANHLKTGSSAAALTIAYGRLRPSPGSLNSQGVAIFSYRANGVLVSETAVPASPPLQAGRIYAENAGAVRTGIAIANPNDVDATISFYFTDKDGASFGSGVATIPANQQIARFLDENPFNGSADARSFTFTSSVPVGAIALRGYTNERSDFLMTTLPVAPIVPIARATVVLPHYAAGGGWTTEVLLVNPSDGAITGAVNMDAIYDYAIPPRSAVKVVSSSAGSQIRTGTITVSPGPFAGSTPVVSSVFSFVAGGVTVTQSGVATTGVARSFRIFAEFDSAATMETGVAVANTTGSAADLRFELLDVTGRPTSFSGAATVPPSGHLSLFLSELPGFENLPSSTTGVLRITSNADISAIGLRGRYNERSDFLISTMPALPDNAPATTGELLFPHIVTGSGYTTEFVLMSPGASASGVVLLRSQAGADLPLSFVR